MLHKLHEQGYVHGDMRKENIIFGADDEDTTSYLIDFDMAKQEGATYPKGFKYFENLRHEEAREGNAMKKEHDRFSLRCVMKLFAPHNGVHACKAAFLMDQVYTNENCSISLLSIASELEKVTF